MMTAADELEKQVNDGCIFGAICPACYDGQCSQCEGQGCYCNCTSDEEDYDEMECEGDE